MTQTDEVLLLLVRCVVRGQCNETMPEDIAWTSLFTLANRQAIPAFLVDGLQRYFSVHPEVKPFAGESATDKLKRMQWLGQLMAYERFYAKHERVMADLARVYAKADVRMMVLKGYGLSLDWPVPNHRSVGDLDIYHFGRWQEADSLVATECGVKVDGKHEHHTVFRYEGVPVENHYDFINTKAHRDAPMIEERLKALAEKGCRRVDVQRATIYLPSADFNAIFLMRHMGQHFAGEHLNLRQVLDWGFFVRAHCKEVDWDEAMDFLRKIGLYVFFNQINAICVDYLGFEEGLFPPIERKGALEQRILSDILHPEFAEEKPESGLLPVIAFKLRRWWYNRWKHPLVYKDRLLPMFITLLWSHLRRYKTIKD